MKLQRSVDAAAAPSTVFAYLSDFTTTNEWDLAHDTMEIAPLGDGCRVTYTADFEFKGLGKLVAPLLRPALKKLGDEAEQGLRDALARL